MTDDTAPGILVHDPSSEARAALDELVTALDACLEELRVARRHAIDLGAQHDTGRSWTAIAAAETRPLIVERLTVALDMLSRNGSRWRRAQALALHAEGASINHIAALFRVTRQRISALINGGPRTDHPVAERGHPARPRSPGR